MRKTALLTGPFMRKVGAVYAWKTLRLHRVFLQKDRDRLCVKNPPFRGEGLASEARKCRYLVIYFSRFIGTWVALLIRVTVLSPTSIFAAG